MMSVLSRLESNLNVLCVTGVEDSLQVDVPVTLELLKNAGIKVLDVWFFFVNLETYFKFK